MMNDLLQHKMKGMCRALRTMLLLLMMTLEVGEAWGQTPNYSGQYYIASRDYVEGNDASNFYLCPTEGWIYYKATDNFTEDDNGQPFLTSYQCKDGVYDVRKAIWTIEYKQSAGGKDYYNIKHTLDGKYLVSNGQISDAKNTRLRVHLEDITDPSTLTANKALFTITVPQGKTYLVISPKDNSGYYLNVTQGNVNSLQGSTTTQEGQPAKNDGPTGHKNDIHGTVGAFNNATDVNAPMYLEPEPTPITEAPVITNNFDGTITITAASGTTLHYTTNSEDPDENSPSTPNTITLDETITTIKAYATSTGCYDSRIVTYKLPQCNTPVIMIVDDKFNITCSTSGASIYYTTDADGTPTTSYNNTPFSTSGISIVKAIAKKNGYIDSEVAYCYNTITVTKSSQILANMRGSYRLGAGFTSTEPIGTSDNPFKGIIDGQYITLSGRGHALIGYADGATIKNVVLDNVDITSNAHHVGAICNEATGTTKIYNCGVLGGSVSGSSSTNVGGLVGLIKSNSKVRVVNCYNYATVSGGSTMAGVVGKNEGTVGDVRIAMCMMYGDMAGTSPVYAGNHVSNNKDFSEYNYWRNKASLTYSAYNDQLAIANDDYLTRWPFYRHILNTHRELATYFLFDDYDPAHISEIGHWVLNRDKGLYPIIEEWKVNTHKTPKKGNYTPPTTTDDNVGKLLTHMGDQIENGYLKVSVVIDKIGTSGDVDIEETLYLPITDMNVSQHDYTYGKVILPFANEIGSWTPDYSKVCTGWKITSVTKGSSSFTTSSVSNYDFADRDNPQKDIYDAENNPFIFAQGGYYIVPYGVTAITIKTNFATAFYLSDPQCERAYDAEVKNPTDLGGTVRETYHNKTIYTSLSTLVSKLSNKTNPHEQAIVLVGNYHYVVKGTGDVGLNTAKAVTIMSADDDNNQEPDYGWYSSNNYGRINVPPLRFDFLPNIEIGMASRVTESPFYYSGIGLFNTKGWFEFTETSVSNMIQCEIESKNFSSGDNKKGNNPWIANSGCFDQIIRSKAGACTQLSYIKIGGNAYVNEFYPGSHSDNGRENTAIPIIVTGGQVEECYMTGSTAIGNDGVYGKLKGDMIYFWCAGGKIGKFLGAYMEEPVSASDDKPIGLKAKIDHAKITRFFGGGTSENARIKGNIDITINNSTVDFYCGGPEFGDMYTGKTVTTRATNTIFGKYYGAGFGGTSITYAREQQDNDVSISTDKEYTLGFSYYTDNRLQNPHGLGLGTCYKFDYLYHSSGVKAVARFYTGYAKFSLATTGSVTNILEDCTINSDFYGAGCQGKVAGTVTSTLTNCIVNGSAFGGGYKAEANDIDVYTETQPTYSTYYHEKGVFGDFGTQNPETYHWEQANNEHDAGDVDGTAIYTDAHLNELGNVTDDIQLTIKGKKSGEIYSVTGNVFGGGNESPSQKKATVVIEDAGEGNSAVSAVIHGSVYGGGNEAPVGTDSKVTLKGNTIVDGNVFGGGNEGPVSGTSTVNIEE